MTDGKKKENRSYKFETLQLHAGQESVGETGARAVPIYATTSYVFADSSQAAERFALREGGNIYSRLTNPTCEVFEKRMAALEGGAAAVAFASGSAAIDCAVRNITPAGGHIVSASGLYGGTHNLFAHTFAQMGIEVSFTDGTPAGFERAIRPNTTLFYLESLGNPNSDVADLEAVAAVAHRRGLPVIVDNTFSTPYLFRPLEHGADIVVHSATKFIGGHGTSLGGVVVDGGTFDWEAAGKFPALTSPDPSYHGLVFSRACGRTAYAVRLRAALLRDQGACLSPFNAFLLLQGLETLSLRVERHVENALRVVEYLAAHPQVERVNHPALAAGRQAELYQKFYPRGGGSIFTFEIAGGAETARRFTEELRLFSLLANVADGKSLVIHPASTTHSQLSEAELAAAGIRPNTVRLSIGTEHIDDILADLAQAFESVR